MSKVGLIIAREYLSRVRKKSFIVMTILGPLLIGAMLAAIMFMSQSSDEVRTIAVVDETGLFKGRLHGTGSLRFEYMKDDIGTVKAAFPERNYYAILYIPHIAVNDTRSFRIFSDRDPSLNTLAYIRNALKQEIEEQRLVEKGIDKKILESIKVVVRITTVKMTGEGEKKSNSELTSTVGFVSGLLIYIFIFMYGVQVLRGVIEEKTSRIAEVIISSVRPFQLMMGKIIGIALVGLTQFVLWMILSFAVISAVSIAFQQKEQGPEVFRMVNQPAPVVMNNQNPASQEGEFLGDDSPIKDIMSNLDAVNFPVMIGSFIFYFLGGYLLYSALFAAIGSAVDSETDTQQFMLPITIPLLLAYISTFMVIENPEGRVAFWLSIIPLTSPVVMMVRIPFGVPYWELLLSMALLVAGFIGSVWLAAKIYRTGILLYGKKVTYREIGKWLFYK